MKFQKSSNELWVVGCRSKHNGDFIPFTDSLSMTKKHSIQKFCKPFYKNERSWKKWQNRGYSVEKVSLTLRISSEKEEVK